MEFRARSALDRAGPPCWPRAVCESAPSRVRAFAAACCALLACKGVDLEHDAFACHRAEDCRPGEACTRGACVIAAGEADAGAPDSGTPASDAGSHLHACTVDATCGVGKWCGPGATCAPCAADDALHCGTSTSPVGCSKCAGDTPACRAGACVCARHEDCGA